MAETASCFVHFLRAYCDDVRIADDSLRTRSWHSAADAYGLEFRYAFRDREEFRHRAEGLTAEVHIKTRADHADSAVSEFITDLDHGVVEELNFVDSYDPRIIFDAVEDFTGISDGYGENFIRIVGLDMVFAIAIIDLRFKDLHFLATILRALQTSHELFGLPAKHAPTNNFDEPR